MRCDLKGLVLVLLSTWFRGSGAQEDAVDCSNTDPVTSVVNDPIDLTHDGVIRVYPNVLIDQITATSNNEFVKKYIDASLEQQPANATQSLVIHTTDQFAQYPVEQSAARITLRVDYDCGQGRGRTLLFYQPFKAGNFFRPEFSQSLYEFVLPTPLYAGFELTATFGEIAARDDDLTDNEVQFSSPDAAAQHVRVGTRAAASADHKTYFAELTLEKVVLEIPAEIRFQIVATDSGQPPLNATAEVVLRADAANSLPATPRFEQLLYMAELDERLALPAAGFEVALQASTYSAAVSFALAGGDDQRFFRLEQAADSNVVHVLLAAPLQEADVQGRQSLWFQVRAEHERLVEAGWTSVVVAVPQPLPKVGHFEKPLYQGQVVALNNSLAIEAIVYEPADDEAAASWSFELDAAARTYFEVERGPQGEAVLKVAAGLQVSQWAELGEAALVEVELHALEAGTSQASAVVLVHVLRRRLAFESALYEGALDAVGGPLSLAPIVVVSSDNSSDGIGVHLEGADAAYFRLKPAEAGLGATNELQIELNPEAETGPGAWGSNRSFLSFTAVASDALSSARCEVLVRLPLIRRAQPQFAQPLYVGQVGAAELSLEPLLLLPSTVEPNATKFQLAGDDLGLFTLAVRAGAEGVDLRLRRPPTEAELASTFAFLLVLTAIGSEGLTGATSLVLETPLREQAVDEPVFAEVWSSGRVELDADDQQLLSLDAIHLHGQRRVEEFVFLLEGDEADFFAASGDAAANVVRLQQLQSLPELLLTAKTQLNLVLSAFKISDPSVNGSTFVFLELPRRDCPTLPETPSTPEPGPGTADPGTPATPGSVTSDPTTPDPGTAGEPVFDSPFYIFSARPDQVGSIGSVQASVEGSGAAIRYSLNVTNEHLAPRLRIDAESGELQLLGRVSAGVYDFRIEAARLGATTSARARLDVDALVQCEGDQQTVVANALLVKYIEEEREHPSILNVSLGDCALAVADMFPSDKAYVRVDPATQMLVSIAIDREDPVFAAMATPQIQVRLRLECNVTGSPSDPGRRRRAVESAPSSSSVGGGYSSILTEDIPFRRDVTLLNLILVDVNDHAPEFVVPAATRRHLGYPEPGICLELFPEYLVRVQATDLDAGLNAKVRYSMRDDPHFAIDPETGVVYPKAGAFSDPGDGDSTSLLIVATDRDGAADGLRTGAALIVQRLGAESFTLLTLATARAQPGLADVDEALQQLGLYTGLQVEAVRTATIPGNLTSGRSLRRRRAAAAGEDEEQDAVLQRVWVYALDPAANALTAKEFKRQLEALPSNGAQLLLSAETYSEVGLASNQSDWREPLDQESAPQNEGFIAAIAVLAALLAAVCCFILWHFYLRRRCFDRAPGSERLDHKNSAATPPYAVQSPKTDVFLPRFVNHQAGADTTAITTTTATTMATTKRPSLGISGSTTQESTDEGATQQQTRAVDVEAPPQRGHVKFNELVERIHIAVDRQESEEQGQEQEPKGAGDEDKRV